MCHSGAQCSSITSTGKPETGDQLFREQRSLTLGKEELKASAIYITQVCERFTNVLTTGDNNSIKCTSKLQLSFERVSTKEAKHGEPLRTGVCQPHHAECYAFSGSTRG